jgi:thioredoxin-like negative regulator of GroEL
MSIPAYILFKDGKVVEQITGARTKDSLKEMLDKHL